MTIPSIKGTTVEIEEGGMEHEMDNWEEDSQEYCLKQKEGREDISSSRSRQENET